MLTPASTVAIIGFGTTGQRLAVQLSQRGCAVRASDRLLDAAATRAPMQARMQAAGVDPAYTLAAALRGARLVLASIGADSSASLARSIAPLLQQGQTYLELSGATAAVRAANATLVERSGARYVAGHAAQPLLLAGACARELAQALQALGCAATAIATQPQTAFPDEALVESATTHLAPLRRGELP